MSKKSRRRNKRLLMLAALAGGAALMGRGKKKFGTDAGFLKSGAAGGASLADLPDPSAVTGTKYPGANKVVARANVGNTGNTIVRHGGITKSDSGQLVGATNAISPGVRAQILQAKANAPRGIIRPGSVTMQRTGVHPRMGNIYKKGGRVTGVAKRGFGRALMKGKK